MAAESGAGRSQSVGAIFATVRIDTSDVPTKLDGVLAALKRVDAAADKTSASVKGTGTAAIQAGSDTEKGLQSAVRATERRSQAAAKEVYDSEKSLQAALGGMDRRSKAAEKTAQIESRAGRRAGQDMIGSFLVREKALGTLNTATDKARSKMAGFGQTGLQAGRVVQDFAQGGIGGVLNNVEGMVQALGGGAGLAGVMTIVGVAAFIAKPFLVDMAKAIGFIRDEIDPTKTEVEHLQERIKELGDKKIKMQVDRNELASAEADLKRLTRAQEAYNDLKGLKSKHERESESAVDEVLAESPGGAGEIREKLFKAEMVRQEATDPAYLKAQGEAAKMRALADDYARVPGIQEEEDYTKQRAQDLEVRAQTAKGKLAGQAEQEVGKLLDKSEKAGGVGAQQERLAGGLDRVGLGDLAVKVRSRSPKALKAREELEKEIDRENENEAEAIRQGLERLEESSKEKVKEAKQEARDVKAAESAEEKRARLRRQERERKAKQEVSQSAGVLTKGRMGKSMLDAMQKRGRTGEEESAVDQSMFDQARSRLDGKMSDVQANQVAWEIVIRNRKAADAKKRERMLLADPARRMGNGRGRVPLGAGAQAIREMPDAALGEAMRFRGPPAPDLDAPNRVAGKPDLAKIMQEIAANTKETALQLGLADPGAIGADWAQ